MRTPEGLKLAQTFMMTSAERRCFITATRSRCRAAATPTTGRDFPGGFPGDTKNAFTAAGRTAAENDVWNYLAKLGEIRRQLEPLRRGRSLDLLDEEQQMAFARVTDKEAVVVIFNNDTKPVEVSFDVSMIKTYCGKSDADRRSRQSRRCKTERRDVKATMPARAAAILKNK